MDATVPINNPTIESVPPAAPSSVRPGFGIGRTLFFCFVFYLNFIAALLLGMTLAAMFSLEEDPRLTQL